MRSVTAGELLTLAKTDRAIEIRVKVKNGSGTWIDRSSWVESVTIDQDIDQPVSGCTVSFRRDSGTTQSLAPLRSDSVLNRLDDGVTYSPALDVNRAITVEVATTAIGAAVVGADYKLLFEGTIDTVSFERSPISVSCRDLAAPLVDRWVETEASYGSVPGVAVETVMQQILDANFGAGVVPFYTPVSPSYLVSPAYQQQRQSVMDAEQALSQLPGWDVRYRWDAGTSIFRFTLSEPPRSKTTPDHTFGPNQYFDVTRLELDIQNIRNVITVSYSNSANFGNRTTLTVSDATSITKYGRRYLFLQESDTSPINTTAEATTMANAALADLKEPKAEFAIDAPFFWPADLWDLYRFPTNLVHFNTDQDWAVVSISHKLSKNKHRTLLNVRGQPAGGYLSWLTREGIAGGTAGAAKPPYPYIGPLNTEADELSWNLRFNAVYGSGGGGTNLTYTIKTKSSFGSISTLDSGNASAFPKDLAVIRHPKASKVLIFSVTDAATGMTAEATWPIPSVRPEVTDTGNPKRAHPFDDGKWTPLTTNAGGTNLDPTVVESGLKPVNRLYAKTLAGDPDIFDSVADGTTYKKIVSVSGGQVTAPSIAPLAVTDAKVNDMAAGKMTAGNLVAGINESGGKPVNRLFAKVLAGDADNLDPLPDGSTYKKILNVSSGLVQTTSIAALAVTDAKINDAAAGKLTAGTLVSGVLESGGKAINKLFAKALAGDADTLDSAPDGSTYKKVTGVVSNLITPSSSTGRNRCKVYKSANQSIATGTTTALTFDTETFDVGGLHDNATNNSRITIPSGGDTGVWLFIAQVNWASNTTSLRDQTIRKNGTTPLGAVRAPPNSGVQDAQYQVVGVDNAPAVGDYYEVTVLQSTGGNLDVISGANGTHFTAQHLW